MNLKERKKDLSFKMQCLGYTKFQRNLDLAAMYNPLGFLLRSPKKIGKLIDQKYDLTQESITQAYQSKKIDQLLHKIQWEGIEFRHGREGMNIN